MKEYIKCKACGYIMEKTVIPDTCPACGLKGKLFEDIRINLGSKRKLFMDMNFHPILVHFPQAITGMIPFFALLSMVANAGIGIKLLNTLELFTWILPFTVLLAIISGILDGKNRFKKINTPALKKKILLGITLLFITLVMTLCLHNNGIKDSLYQVSGLSILCLGVQAVLAKTGIKLFTAYLPG